MSNLTELVGKFGSDDKNTDLGNGFKIITRHAINGTQIFVEFELYKNNARVYNPIDLDETEFPDDQYNAMERAINSHKEGQMMEIEEGKLQMTAKNVWYAVGDTYPIKDSLGMAGMTWEPSLKHWAKLDKPVVDAELIQIKTYKTENMWTYY